MNAAGAHAGDKRSLDAHHLRYSRWGSDPSRSVASGAPTDKVRAAMALVMIRHLVAQRLPRMRAVELGPADGR